jgi:hypothetical protein
MTTKQAIKVVRQIILDNRENEELEGILNRHRIAALNHLVGDCDRRQIRIGISNARESRETLPSP